MINKTLPAIFGISGTELTIQEKKFFEENNVIGIILFTRNILNKSQVIRLNNEIRDILGNNIIISVDQEGGRVRRLKNEKCSEFRYFPPAYSFHEIYKKVGLKQAKEKVFENYFNLASELKELGFNMNYAPVCDLIIKNAHEIIGDRGFSEEAEIVIELANACIEAHKKAGIYPVIKHIPGHGRALSDSHEELPIIKEDLTLLEGTDFRVFSNLNNKADYAMTAHIIYECLDIRSPATMSPTLIKYIRNKIGFKGKLITDDINMKALHVRLKELEDLNSRLDYITRKSLDSGCDIILHCNGVLEEMQTVVKAIKNFYS